ncbi:MAG TPA: alpha/beta fold hydrolase [Acidimicrobiales bacterium]|nr:alpha/beta fold hydrolase [Acidimicrobiales bacterium]
MEWSTTDPGTADDVVSASALGSATAREHRLDQEMAALGWRVPAGRHLDLPGRGTTFIRDTPGPSEHAPTVLLLHGLAATGGLNWYPVFGELSRHFRVVAIDHRGHGRGLRSHERFRLAHCADDAVAVADALGVERFIPVGYSMGGPIAQLVWHRHRRRVDALVLCATSRNFRGRVRERVQFMGLGMLVAGKWGGDPVNRITRMIEELLVPSMGQPELRRWALRELNGHDIRKVVEAAEALGRYSSHDWIGDIDVPVSVVVPTSDRLVPVRRQVKLARSIPSAVLFPVEGTHLVSAVEPDEFASVVADACLLAADRAARHGRPGARR